MIEFYQKWTDIEEWLGNFLLINGALEEADLTENSVQGWVDRIWKESEQWGPKYLGHFAAVPLTASSHTPPGQSYQVPVGTLPTHHSWFSRLLDWVGSAWTGGRSRGSCGVQTCTPANKLTAGADLDTWGPLDTGPRETGRRGV